MTTIPWSTGRWTNDPEHVSEDAGTLLVTARCGSDAWRVTSYGFTHDDEHALLAPFEPETAVEVEFTPDFSAQFDQAGIFVRASEDHWIKTGVEYADGSPQLGAVVTNPFSDWSVAPVPHWNRRRTLLRVSRSGDALTVRAAVDGGDLALVRLLPLPADLAVEAGPFLCAPTREGLTVPFHAWRVTAPDVSLH